MGNACGSSSSPQERDVSHNIDKNLIQQQTHLRKEVKLLLLGTGESGKTTIIKQLRHIYDRSFNPEELDHYRTVINGNIIASMNILAIAVIADGSITNAPEIQEQANLLANRDMATSSDLNSDITKAVNQLWNNPVIKKRYDNRSDLQIIDSASYFFDNLDRISASDYTPSNQDIMYARSRTIGINEITFKLAGRPLRLVDVGGQRSERRKWIHCFENVSAIFFIIAISEYDQVLREDETTNRLTESMNLFSEITQIQFFRGKPILLFLNKSDLFKEKISRVPLSGFFPDYNGGDDYEKGIAHLQKEFKGIPAKSGDTSFDKKTLYFHATCATDTENVKFVFKATQHIFMSETIEQIGIY
eukprot:TRINITY_DN8507_c0_g1_i1.p1 TRINITY_DN8507_c0_g1~~TRINITY_DN8507_c0_g1_i1.p1  ORF type:complete len:360 (-),score=79.16 TRINITY_DN8507_c0_g1_i1:205-1284(-)